MGGPRAQRQGIPIRGNNLRRRGNPQEEVGAPSPPSTGGMRALKALMGNGADSTMAAMATSPISPGGTRSNENEKQGP